MPTAPRTARRALLVVLAAAAVLLSGLGAAQAATYGDGSGPLPGYTISNPALPPVAVGDGTSTVYQGTYRNAAFVVERPPSWNGQLVMWAHGYRGNGTELTVDPPAYGLRELLLSQGYAWAASSYQRNGYDVATGVTSTKDLATYSADLLGKQPSRTYLVGVSMGGHVTGRSIEQYPGFYAGAMPMCGVLGDNKLFDYFLDYNLAAQALAGVDAYPFPADYQTAVVPQIQAAIGLTGVTPTQPVVTDPLGKQLRAVTVNVSGGPRPGTDGSFAYWKDFLSSLGSPDTGGSLAANPGRVATNVFTTYKPNRPVNLQATVERVAPTDIQSRYNPGLTEIPRIKGDPTVPVLTLHDIGDLFVPFSMEQLYANKVANNGKSKLLVQRAIRGAGHCEFTPTEVGTAWNDLRAWVTTGAKPAGDNVTRKPVLRDPSYGCRFTDPTAYADPADYPTRAYFPRCPASS